MVPLARPAAALGLVAAVLFAPNPARSGPALVQLSLKPHGSSRVAQGVEFPFDAMATNPGPNPVEVGVTFSLSEIGTGTPVAFSTWELPEQSALSGIRLSSRIAVLLAHQGA